MALHRLKFDTTDADTIADSPSVGAYVRASDGTLITNTSGALDVYLQNASVVVTATDLDIRDLAAATDSVSSWLKDGSGTAITSTAGALDVNLKSPITVDVDLEGVYAATTNETPDSAGAIYHTRAATITIEEQVERTTAGLVGTIAAADLADVKAIDVNAFALAINDSSGDAQVLSIDNASGGLKVDVQNSITINDVGLANSAIAAAANSIDTNNTAENLVASPLANRKYLWVYNNGNKVFYIGQSGVTTANGFPMPSGSILEMRLGAAVDIEFVGASGAEARTLEIA